MDENTNSNQCLAILEAHKVELTSVRVRLMSLLLDRAGHPFSIKDIKEEVKTKSLPIGESSIVSNLQLFSIRGIIKPVMNDIEHERRGRPQSVFVLNERGKQPREEEGQM